MPLPDLIQFFWRARRWPEVFFRLACLCGSLFWVVPAAPAQAPADNHYLPPKRVLLVFNESRDLPGNAMMEQALRAEMLKESASRIDFFVENLDVTRFSDENHARAFREFLQQKYSGQHLDLVVAFMGRDFNLTNEISTGIFARIPIVFVAVSEQSIPDVLRRPGYSGILQRYDVAGTFSLMLRLQPATHRVVVVSGVSADDRLTLERIRAVGQSLDGIECEFWTNRPLGQLGAGLSTLPKGTVIFLGTLQRNLSSQPYYSSQLIQLVAPRASVPIYGLGAGLVGGGLLGGSVVDYESLGTRAGQLAMEQMRAGITNRIPVEVSTIGTPMVDWRELRRWGISESRLPADCVVRYQPHSTWTDHKQAISLATTVFLAQAFTIAALLINRRHRRRAEAKARANQEARALLAAIVETSDDAIIRKDLDGRIITWNRGAERMFGYAASEIIGWPIAITVPPMQQQVELENLERTRRGVPIHNYETVRQHKDGRLVEVSITISPIFDETGRVVGASKICRDISRRKAAEMEIRKQREELAHVTRISTLGQLTTALTHELNQPLGAILRNAEAAEMFLQAGQPDLNEVRAILADIRRDDQRAGQVIERMRLLLKRRSLESHPLDLREVVEDIVTLVRPDLLARQVTLTLDLPGWLPLVPGDRVHLQQVLLNLLLNAMDAMNGHPGAERRLTVRVKAGLPGWLEVTVSDAGTGLPPEESPRLFETFYTTKPNGMGMGLAISRTIIEAHGGKIRAENNPGPGASFIFTLPCGPGAGIGKNLTA